MLQFPKATKIAAPRDFSFEQSVLALSLQCYVSGDDTVLNRRDFLVNVRDRIDMDIEAGEY